MNYGSCADICRRHNLLYYRVPDFFDRHGAILGCAGGLVSLFVGVLISMLGVGAIINFIVSRNDKHEINISEIVDLINRNGKWAFS